jgi:hypothetical protein
MGWSLVEKNGDCGLIIEFISNLMREDAILVFLPFFYQLALFLKKIVYFS